MNNADFGVKYPCYGEYKCYGCNKAWASSKCWRDFGQKCKSCNDIVKPNEKSLLQLYYYNCKTCDKVWKHKRVDEGQPCKTCNTLIQPVAHNEYVRSRIGKPTLFKNSGEYDRKGGHREDLCEKCQKYGAPCSLTYNSTSKSTPSRVGSSSIPANTSRQPINSSRQSQEYRQPQVYRQSPSIASTKESTCTFM